MTPQPGLNIRVRREGRGVIGVTCGPLRGSYFLHVTESLRDAVEQLVLQVIVRLKKRGKVAGNTDK